MAENNPNRVRLRRQADNRANRIHAARSRVWGFVSKRRSPQRLRHDRRMMTSFLGLPQSTCATTAAAIACRFELADTRIHHRRTAGKDCQIDAWRRWSSYSSTAGLCDQGEGSWPFALTRPGHPVAEGANLPTRASLGIRRAPSSWERRHPCRRQMAPSVRFILSFDLDATTFALPRI